MESAGSRADIGMMWVPLAMHLGVKLVDERPMAPPCKACPPREQRAHWSRFVARVVCCIAVLFPHMHAGN